MSLRTLVLTATLLQALPAEAKTQRRCGWYHHPTLGSHYLEDADGEWRFSEDVLPPAIDYVTVPGFDDAYDRAFDDRVRVDYGGQVTNHSYGLSCACAVGEFRGDRVVSLSSLTEQPMTQCADDANLPGIELYGQ